MNRETYDYICADIIKLGEMVNIKTRPLTLDDFPKIQSDAVLTKATGLIVSYNLLLQHSLAFINFYEKAKKDYIANHNTQFSDKEILSIWDIKSSSENLSSMSEFRSILLKGFNRDTDNRLYKAFFGADPSLRAGLPNLPNTVGYDELKELGKVLDDSKYPGFYNVIYFVTTSSMLYNSLGHNMTKRDFVNHRQYIDTVMDIRESLEKGFKPMKHKSGVWSKIRSLLG